MSTVFTFSTTEIICDGLVEYLRRPKMGLNYIRSGCSIRSNFKYQY